MDWTKALKVGGPSVVLTYAFYELMKQFAASSELLQDSLLLNIIFLTLIFLFCVYVSSRVISSQVSQTDKIEKVEVIDNTIEENEVDSSLNVAQGKASISLKNNKINKNKVKGDLNIG
jgi:hypothetical protein